MKTFNVYFLYDSSKNLLYVGKSISLKNRLMSHFSKDLLESEPWKNEVDQENIIIYHCANDADLDIYETYFINKYRPRYNKDKVFTGTLTFELPYLEPQVYNLLKERKTGNLRMIIKKYCDGYLDLDTAVKLCPLLKETNEFMTKEDYKRFGYQPNKIKTELNNIKLQKINVLKIINCFAPGFYQSKGIKLLLINLYKEFGIDRNAKASDIEEIFNIQPIRKSLKGKTVVGYQVH